MTDMSSAGNVPRPQEEPSSLPPFVLKRPDGLHIVLTSLDSPASFREFVEDVFESGSRFADLDYDRMHRLLYECHENDIANLVSDFQAAGMPPVLRLAADIVPFPLNRRKHYHSVKMIEGGRAAVYQFSPASVKRMSEAVNLGKAHGDGKTAVADPFDSTATDRVKLDVDEFVAAMWNIFVRYGLDIELIRKMIDSDRSESAIIARGLPPKDGKDACVDELSSYLHRDNSPKQLANGRINLHQFENRFPQVPKNTRLIRKVPGVAGKPGWDISGNPLLPYASKDFDIARRAGTGTRVERTEEGEFVVTDADGFLEFNPATGAFAISNKIVNHQGVSLRTTGNLILTGDEYEEHGEVQEQARVEGKNMTFMADVFGDIVSRGGLVTFRKNLSGGLVNSPNGVISVNGRASHASIEAVGGDIMLAHAEGCLIIGKRVRIKEAVHCDIVADELVVDTATGCALAARRMQVGTANAWHDSENMISMLVPNLSAIAEKVDEFKAAVAKCQEEIGALVAEIEAILSQQDVKNYSTLASKLRAGEIRMNPEQEANWQKLLDRVAPALRKIKTCNDRLKAVREESGNLEKCISDITQQSREMSADIACKIAVIDGETAIRTLKIRPNAPALSAMPPNKLRAYLRESNADCDLLFNGRNGDFKWAFQGKAV
jgi:uncharacterized protein